MDQYQTIDDASARIVFAATALGILALTALALTGASAGFLDAVFQGMKDFIVGNDLLHDITKFLGQYF